MSMRSMVGGGKAAGVIEAVGKKGSDAVTCFCGQGEERCGCIQAGVLSRQYLTTPFPPMCSLQPIQSQAAWPDSGKPPVVHHNLVSQKKRSTFCV